MSKPATKFADDDSVVNTTDLIDRIPTMAPGNTHNENITDDPALYDALLSASKVLFHLHGQTINFSHPGDLANEAYVRIRHGSFEFRGEASKKTIAYRVIRNLYHDEWRKQKVRRSYREEYERQHSEDVQAGPHREALMHIALDSLSSEQLNLLDALLAKKSLATISQEIGRPKSQVKKDLRNLLDLLVAQIEQ